MARCYRCGKFILFDYERIDGSIYCRDCYMNLMAEKDEYVKQQKKQEEQQEEKSIRYQRMNNAIRNGTDAQADIMDKTEWTEFFKNINQQTFIVFDTETTGLDPIENEIIEIGAIKVSNGQIVDEFNQLIKPKYGLNAEAMAVNNITGNMLKDMPPMKEVLPRFFAFIGDSLLVAHNAEFDIRFLLVDTMNYYDPPYAKYHCVDTLKIAKNLWKKESVDNYKLETLLQFIDYEPNEKHRALEDAKATYALLNAEVDALKAEEYKKVLKSEVRAYLKKNSPCTKQSIRDAFPDASSETIDSLIEGFKIEGKLERIKIDGVYMLEYGTPKDE